MSTAAKIQLSVQPRAISGRAVKSLRRAGLVPAVVYGHNFPSVNLQVPVKDFARVYAQAGESTLIYLDINGEPGSRTSASNEVAGDTTAEVSLPGNQHPVIIKYVQRDARDDSFQHADFYKVNLTEKIHAKIPLTFIGESPAVKGLGGILVKNINEIEVVGLPQDLPHEIAVDITKLIQFKDHITVADLGIAGNLTVSAKPEEIVALIQEPISEEELKAQLEVPTATAEEVEVIKKEKPETEAAEGETPAVPAASPAPAEGKK